MAYSPHVRIQWGGPILDSVSGTGNEVEEWTCTLSAIRAGGGMAMDSLLSDCVTAISAFHSRAGTGIHPTAALAFVKVNEVGADGHQLTDPTQVTLFGTPVRGGVVDSTINPVISTALKVTLDDGTRNRRRKGGFYLPRPGFTVGRDGRYSATDMAGVVTSAKTLLDHISADTGITVAIASKVDASLTPVTRIRVGNVPDNLRRRRRDLIESYSFGTIVP